MEKKSESVLGTNWPTFLLVGICIVLIIAMAVLMAVTTKATPLENALMTFILTAASSVISYLVAKLFAERGFNQVMRDHGVQIARGIIELKTQISSLSDWVCAKRALLTHNQHSTENVDPTLEHVELTLQAFRGLADNAVGGIAGVIGDAYSQYEDFIDQVSHFRSEAQIKTFEIEKEMEAAGSAIDMAKLQERINEIALQTEQKISQLAKTASLPVPPTPTRRLFSTQCPMCSGVTSFEMVDRAGETKPILCKQCGGRFNAHLSATQEIFTRRISGPEAPAHADALLSTGPWDNAKGVQEEARTILQKTQAYVDPNFLSEIIQLVIKHDRKLRRAKAETSPWALQAQVLTDQEKKVSHVAVRAFFKLIFLGDGFDFGAESKVFKSRYQNTLAVEELESAFARGAIGRLSKLRPVTAENTAELTSVLFRHEGDGREDVVAAAISQLPPGGFGDEKIG